MIKLVANLQLQQKTTARFTGSAAVHRHVLNTHLYHESFPAQLAGNPLKCLHKLLACLMDLSCSSVFTALHVMQTRYSEENSVRLSVCLSVRPSVTRVIPDKTEERSVQIFTSYERTFILVF